MPGPAFVHLLQPSGLQPPSWIYTLFGILTSQVWLMMFEGQENMLSIQLSNTTCCNLLKKTFYVSQNKRKKKKEMWSYNENLWCVLHISAFSEFSEDINKEKIFKVPPYSNFDTFKTCSKTFMMKHKVHGLDTYMHACGSTCYTLRWNIFYFHIIFKWIKTIIQNLILRCICKYVTICNFRSI